jgi:hypothetical protein
VPEQARTGIGMVENTVFSGICMFVFVSQSITFIYRRLVGNAG